MSIETMRQAADTLEIGLAYPGMRFYHDNIRAVITALRTVIEQAEKQEPDGVGWLRKDGGYFAQPAAQQDAVLAEREACAKVADLVAREIDDTNGTATYIAAFIRARGEA
jgi:hypothetical protein